MSSARFIAETGVLNVLGKVSCGIKGHFSLCFWQHQVMPSARVWCVCSWQHQVMPSARFRVEPNVLFVLATHAISKVSNGAKCPFCSWQHQVMPSARFRMEPNVLFVPCNTKSFHQQGIVWCQGYHLSMATLNHAISKAQCGARSTSAGFNLETFVGRVLVMSIDLFTSVDC